jgi:hypothetical protein
VQELDLTELHAASTDHALGRNRSTWSLQTMPLGSTKVVGSK